MKAAVIALYVLLGLGMSGSLAQTAKPIEAMLDAATVQVEREKGRRIAFAPIKSDCPPNPAASTCNFRAGNSFLFIGRHHATGVRMFTMIRVGTSDADWRDAASVLLAFMEPELPSDQRSEALGALLNSVRGGSVSGQLLGHSVLSAGYDKSGREQWGAIQDEGLLAVKPPRP